MKVKIAAAALAASLLAGCGAQPQPPSQTTATAPSQTTATAPAAAAKPTPTKRGEMVKCLQGVGWKTESPTTVMLRVKSPAGHPVAVILVYKTTKAAARSASAGRTDGLVAASFGKAEVNYFGKALDRTSSESKVLTDCVTASYGTA